MRYFSGLFALLLLAVAPAFGWEYWGGDARRLAVFTAQPDHAGQCRQSGAGVGVSHRRSRSRPPALMARTKFEATPLFVEDSLVFCSPFNEVIALDPGTGAQKWRYDPKISTEQRPANRYNCRGVAHWVDRSGGQTTRPVAPASSWAPTMPASLRSTRGPASPAPISATMARSRSTSGRSCSFGRANSRSPRRRW